MEHKYLVGSVCVCFFWASFSSNAALVAGDVLEFSSNSYFALDSNASGSFELAEQISISMNEGIRIGAIQTSSGSHGGAPNGSELPTIDTPWQFSGNTGMHSTTSAITEVSSGDLDFSGSPLFLPRQLS